MKAPLLESFEDGVSTLLLNRPSTLNSYDLELLVHLQQAIERCSEREDVRVIVLMGSGSSFCAGQDIQKLHKWLETGDTRSLRRSLEAFKQILLRLRRIPQLTLALVNGVAADGGLNLALACDLQLASSRVSLGYPFLQLGLSPELGTSYLIPPRVGHAVYLSFITSGRMIHVPEAIRIGLLEQQVVAQDFASSATKLIRRLRELPPVATRNIKRAYHWNNQSLEKLLDVELEARIRSFQSDDCREGLRAFLSNRKPLFKGE